MSHLRCAFFLLFFFCFACRLFAFQRKRSQWLTDSRHGSWVMFHITIKEIWPERQNCEINSSVCDGMCVYMVGFISVVRCSISNGIALFLVSLFDLKCKASWLHGSSGKIWPGEHNGVMNSSVCMFKSCQAEWLVLSRRCVLRATFCGPAMAVSSREQNDGLVEVMSCASGTTCRHFSVTSQPEDCLIKSNLQAATSRKEK